MIYQLLPLHPKQYFSLWILLVMILLLLEPELAGGSQTESPGGEGTSDQLRVSELTLLLLQGVILNTKYTQ